MRHLQHGRMWLEMIVDPAGEHRRFHRCAPRLRKRSHPVIQIQTCGGNRTLGVNPAAAVLHAVADLPLVNIQADVIHRLHGGASLVSLNQRLLSSAFLHQTLLLRPIHSNLPGVETLRDKLPLIEPISESLKFISQLFPLRRVIPLLLAAVFVLVSGCRDSAIIWSAKSPSPDGGWVAIATTEQFGGPGTTWPKPSVFHVLATEQLFRQLAALAGRHAESEVCDHFHAYKR